MKEENKRNQKKMLLAVFLLILLVIGVVGITYAVFSYTKKGNVENTIRTGKITMSYTEGENGITLENAYPIEDSVGKVLSDPGQVFDFTVNINLYGNSLPISYEVTGEKDPNSTLADSDVRIYLEKSSDGTNYSAVSAPSGYVALGSDDEFGAKGTEMLLDRASTNETSTFNYRLRMWVGSSYKVSGEERYFTMKVNVYGNDGIPVEVNGVEMDKASATVKLTNTLQLNATMTPASPTDKSITWTSSNEKVATVSSTGLVEAKGIGTTTITATSSNGKSATSTVRVVVDNTNITGSYIYNETTCPTGKEETCEPSSCLLNKTANSCIPGSTISYKVNDNETEDFYVLKDNGSTVTLISTRNVTSVKFWDAAEDNSNGPGTATQALEIATSEWSNVSTNTYNESTGIATHARMITKAEAESVGCQATVSNSCPIWIASTFHWTSTPDSSSTTNAWYVYGNGRYLNSYGIALIENLAGVRAVIEISK